MIEDMTKLQKGLIEEINTQMLFPLLRWLSGRKDNLLICSYVNKMFFFVKPNILLHILHLNMKGFGKYPKPSDTKSEKIKIIEPYVSKYYKWSKNEFRKNIFWINKNIEDKLFLNMLNEMVGFEKDECKKLQLDFKKIDEKSKAVSKGVFEFA